MAGRIAYYLGANGATMTVDTACSSSLVATDAARRMLLSQNDKDDRKLAIVGGVALMVDPMAQVERCRQRLLSVDNHCRTFDRWANGYARGEGCAVAVLRRMTREQLLQQQHGHCPPLAVISASHVNQDGASSTLVAPNGVAQQKLIQQCLEQTNYTTDDVILMETHGTGTPLGDPIELNAIAEVYGQRRADNQLLITTSKTSIGHCEAVAGLAGLIKTICTMKYNYVPLHRNFASLNPKVDMVAVNGTLPIDGVAIKFERNQVAAINSFGLSGTNSHAIILPWNNIERHSSDARTLTTFVLPYSAKNPNALELYREKYMEYLNDTSDELNIADMCATAALARNHFKFRSAVIGNTLDEIQTNLITNKLLTRTITTNEPRIALIFTGQGSEQINMSRTLYEENASYRHCLDNVTSVMLSETGMDILKYIFNDNPNGQKNLQRTEISQPALFCIEYALASMWKMFGVTKPIAMLGHSLGEYVALTLSGIIPSLQHACRIVVARGKCMARLYGEIL